MNIQLNNNIITETWTWVSEWWVSIFLRYVVKTFVHLSDLQLRDGDFLSHWRQFSEIASDSFIVMMMITICENVWLIAGWNEHLTPFPTFLTSQRFNQSRLSLSKWLLKGTLSSFRMTSHVLIFNKSEKVFEISYPNPLKRKKVMWDSAATYENRTYTSSCAAQRPWPPSTQAPPPAPPGGSPQQLRGLCPGSIMGSSPIWAYLKHRCHQGSSQPHAWTTSGGSSLWRSSSSTLSPESSSIWSIIAFPLNSTAQVGSDGFLSSWLEEAHLYLRICFKMVHLAFWDDCLSANQHPAVFLAPP